MCLKAVSTLKRSMPQDLDIYLYIYIHYIRIHVRIYVRIVRMHVEKQFKSKVKNVLGACARTCVSEIAWRYVTIEFGKYLARYVRMLWGCLWMCMAFIIWWGSHKVKYSNWQSVSDAGMEIWGQSQLSRCEPVESPPPSSERGHSVSW